MKSVLSIICIAILIVACKKIKEKKFTGTFSGTMEWTQTEHEFEDGVPLPYATYTGGSYETTATVERTDDIIYLNKNSKHAIYIKDIRGRQQELNYFYKGGGGKYYNYTVTENSLTYSNGFNTYFGAYEASKTYTFTGTKIE